MAKHRMGLLAGTAGLALGACYTGRLGVPMTPSERRLGRYLRAPEGHEGGGSGGEGGGGAGAASLLDDDEGGGSGGEGGGGGGSGGEGGAGGEGGGGGEADLAWASGVSAEKGEGEEASNLDWLKSTGVKDINGLTKIARDSQRAARESGRVKIPTADSKPEEVKAFREAMGVPEKADGYEVELPKVEGGDYEVELDTSFLEPMREIAHAGNMPAPVFKALADKFVELQLEAMKGEAVENDKQAAATLKEWGGEADAKKMDLKRGAQILGLKKQDVALLQRGGNVGRVMNLLAKVGSLAGEDFFAQEGGAQKFGIGSEEEAQAELDKMTGDRDVYAKLKAKDPATVAKYDRLVAGVAHFREMKAARSKK